VGGDGEDEGDGRGCGEVERDDGVAGESGEEGAGAAGLEELVRRGEGGLQAGEAEAGEGEGVAWQVEDGAEDVVDEVLPGVEDGCHAVTVGGAVFAEEGGGVVERVEEGYGVAVGEGVGEGDAGLDPAEAVLLEGEGAEEGGCDGHGVDCGADVMAEAGEGGFFGADAAARLGCGFEYSDRGTRAGECDGGGEAVGSAADDVDALHWRSFRRDVDPQAALLRFILNGMQVSSESLENSFVEMQHVSVMRGDAVVLRDVRLRIAAGESVAILGPNGCGKSTLIQTLTCELYPVVRPGSLVRIFGRERWDVTQLRRMLGVVAAEPPVRDALSVPGLDVVLTGFFSSARLWPHLQPTAEMRERAWEVLRAVGAAELERRPLGEMSAGQQKRVLIARALAASGDGSGRRVLLLDEPGNALDLRAQRELRETMRRLAQQGTGILLVTHHVEDLVPEMGRVILMRGGRIVLDGAKAEALTGASLSGLFGAPVEVVERDGCYFAR